MTDDQINQLITEVKGIQNRLDGIGFTLLGLVVFVVVVVVRHALSS